MAKREMQDAITRRVIRLEEERAKISTGDTYEQRLVITSKIKALEEARSFVRNVMLWDTGND
jgi:hypothetical protein